MAIDLKEDQMFSEYLKAKKEKEEGEDDEFFSNQKSSSIKMSQRDIDDEFDNLDISQFNAQN